MVGNLFQSFGIKNWSFLRQLLTALMRVCTWTEIEAQHSGGCQLLCQDHYQARLQELIYTGDITVTSVSPGAEKIIDLIGHCGCAGNVKTSEAVDTNCAKVARQDVVSLYHIDRSYIAMYFLSCTIFHKILDQRIKHIHVQYSPNYNSRLVFML